MNKVIAICNMIGSFDFVESFYANLKKSHKVLLLDIALKSNLTPDKLNECSKTIVASECDYVLLSFNFEDALQTLYTLCRADKVLLVASSAEQLEDFLKKMQFIKLNFNSNVRIDGVIATFETKKSWQYPANPYEVAKCVKTFLEKDDSVEFCKLANYKLNPIIKAQNLQKILKEQNLSQQQLADRINISRCAITNTLRLLSLTNSVKELILAKKLSEGQARCLVGLPCEKQIEYANICITQKLTARQVEKLVRGEKNNFEKNRH